MKILVTGATGFIGSHFVELALARGHSVIGTQSSGGATKQAEATRLQGLGGTIVRADLLDPASLQEVATGVDCVCHFAGAFRESGIDDARFVQVNVEGTRNLLLAAARGGARRFVYCSTAGIYGQRVPGIITERSPVRPYNSYEESKSAAEAEVRKLAGSSGIDFVIIRPTAVYGPRDERLLKLFKAASRGSFPLFGKGEGRRHMVYVQDLVEACLLAAEVPAARSEDFNIGGPRATPLHELLDTLAKVVGREKVGMRLPLAPMLALAAVIEDSCNLVGIKPPIYRRRMDFYRNDAEYDCSKAARLLGWRAKVDLQEGLAATYSYYRAAGLI